MVVYSVWLSASVPIGRPPVAGDRGYWAKERFCHRGRRTTKSACDRGCGPPGSLATTLDQAYGAGRLRSRTEQPVAGPLVDPDVALAEGAGEQHVAGRLVRSSGLDGLEQHPPDPA